MRTGYIYGVRCSCHPEEGVRYVGQTVVSIPSRSNVHKWNARTPDSKSYGSYFSNWIRKHGASNVEFFVLETTTEDKIDEREDHWITDLRTKGNKLTNVKAGGGQARGHKRPLHSTDMKGENNPMYGKDRRELMAYARSFQGPASEETRRKMGDARRGSKNARARITEDDVRDIRRRYTGAYGELSEMGREYGLTAQSISGIVKRESWKHVEDW